MEWKCCHGYRGEDCNDGPVGSTGSQIPATRPQHRPGYGGGGGGGHGLGGFGGGSSGIVENGGQNGKWSFVHVFLFWLVSIEHFLLTFKFSINQTFRLL